MEPRALLAVTAGIVGSELRVHLGDTNDMAILQVDSGIYSVQDGFNSFGSFSMAAINSIRITGDAAKAGQSLVIRPGDAVADSLTVDAGVDATIVGAPISTPGSVNIASAAITLSESVQTAGEQVYGGVVRLAKDIVLDAGDADIRFTSPIRSTVGLHNVIRDIAMSDQLTLPPGGTVLYASRGSSDVGSGGVHFIDLGGQGRDLVDLGRVAGRLALSADGSRLYAANPQDGTVTVVNTATRAILATIAASGSPTGMALSADGQALYVTNSVDDSLAVISTATNGLVRTIPLAGAPAAVAVGTDGRLWVTAQSGNRVSVVNAATGVIERQINVGRGPHGIAISPDGSRAYVTNTFDGTVSVISTTTGTVTMTIDIGLGPTEIALTADGRWVYVVDGFSNGVAVIETATLTVATRVSVGNEPTGLALSADGAKAYVASRTGISELRSEARSLTVRTNGTIRFTAPESTVDRLRELVVQGNREIESAGSVILSTDRGGNLRAGGTQVRSGGVAVNYDSYRSWGWTARAAEAIRGVHTIVWEHAQSGKLHYWELSAGWVHQTSRGDFARGSAAYNAAEAAFGMDFNGDGVVSPTTTVIESSGAVALEYDGDGNLRANGVLVTSLGGPVNYDVYRGWGWTATAAENVRGFNTIAWRNTSGSLHFWRLSSTWQHLSSDGMHAPGTTGYHAAEVDFATDFNSDGVVGATETIIESLGTATLIYTGAGNLFVNGVPVTSGGNPVNFHSFARIGYTAMAAETVNGTNSIVWRTPQKKLHFWRLSSDWAQVSADSMMVPGAPRYHAAEVAFGRDFDDDGVIGSPFTIIEAVGATRLSYDRAGNLFANGTAITAGGAPVNYQSYARIGYTARAVETVDGVNTLAWVTTESKIHYWRLSGTWAQTSSDSMMVPGRPRYLAAETTFGVDFDGNGRIGS
jgi:YVTN family beta-propeller protein